ncbi:hypothetical protein WMY93_025491 [Mugilogobius chulae]|uniref:Uncharacterized protein n=1 Tax=Mugilogobius chulae TaxID=88201 RepID=A0AAW0MZ17_9GOBI
MLPPAICKDKRIPVIPEQDTRCRCSLLKRQPPLREGEFSKSKPVPSCPVLSCPVLSCPVLSCPVRCGKRTDTQTEQSLEQMTLTSAALCPGRPGADRVKPPYLTPEAPQETKQRCALITVHIWNHWYWIVGNQIKHVPLHALTGSTLHCTNTVRECALPRSEIDARDALTSVLSRCPTSPRPIRAQRSVGTVCVCCSRAGGWGTLRHRSAHPLLCRFTGRVLQQAAEDAAEDMRMREAVCGCRHLTFSQPCFMVPLELIYGNALRHIPAARVFGAGMCAGEERAVRCYDLVREHRLRSVALNLKSARL